MARQSFHQQKGRDLTIAVVADTHAPYHDQRAVDLACVLIEAVKPKELVHLADGVDCYAVSSFDRDPERVITLQNEFDKAFEVNKQIAEAAPEVERYYLESGNHELRWMRYLHKHPEINGLRAMEFENLMRLEESGWKLGGMEREYCAGRLVLKHGKRISKHAGMSARYALEEEMHQRSVMIGHSHRQGFTPETGPRLLVGGWEVGCLCDLNPEYVRHPNWQQGMAFITTGTGHAFSVELALFTGTGRIRRTIFRGQEYTA